MDIPNVFNKIRWDLLKGGKAGQVHEPGWRNFALADGSGGVLFAAFRRPDVSSSSQRSVGKPGVAFRLHPTRKLLSSYAHETLLVFVDAEYAKL